MKRKRTNARPGGKWVYIHMEDAFWELIEQLRGVLNAHLKEVGHRPVSRSNVITAILANNLLDNAGDIQDEARNLGLHRVAVRLAPIFGVEGIATVGLPKVPRTTRARRIFNASLSLR